MSASETIHVHADGRTAWVTLDRPALNVLDIAMMNALSSALGLQLERLNPECDFIVIQGAGPKGFSAGAEVRDHTPDRVAEMLGVFHGIFRRLWEAECITVAAVHGHCLGGGMELATFCDFVIATESAVFGQPEIKLGCFPPVAMVMFPHLAGPRAALDLILTGRTISAREAQQLGLVTRVVPDDRLTQEVDALLAELRQRSPAVLGMTRRALWRHMGLDFDRSLREVEELYLNQLMKTEDAQEGIRAFLEKRVPTWRGR
jgi:cyclohexa-1,5-dienecarbonyl-CoA hydratase